MLVREPRTAGRRPLITSCVLGDIDLVRALGLAGIRSAVMTRAGSPSRYSRSTACVLEHVDARSSPELRVERLLDFAGEQLEPPVLFYDGDWDALLISRLRARLTGKLHFVCADAELVESLIDKERFQALAARTGLPVPRAQPLMAANGGSAAIDLRYPVVIKPLTRHQSTWAPLARAKAMRADDARQLARIAEELAAVGVDALVQEAVLGAETRIESYHVYVGSDGTVAAEFTGRKVRTFPAGYGYSTALEITAERDVLEAGRAAVEAIGLTGVAKLDFKRDVDGALHLLEVNPRFNLWHHPGALAGVNIPAIVHTHLTTGSLPPSTRARAGVRWCSPASDLRAARLEGWSTTSWLRWAAGCEAKSGFAWSDPLPLPRALLARKIAGRS